MISSYLPLLLANAIVLVGAVVQGSVGFGLGLISAPLLVLIEPSLVPGPLLCVALLLTSLILVRERRGVHFGGLAWAVPGRFAGAFVGAAILCFLTESTAGLVFAGVILFVVMLSASGLHLRPTRPALLIAGIISGITSTITSVGGPPLALVYQSSEGAQLRGTLAGHFLLGTICSLIALTSVGKFGVDGLLLALGLAPGIVCGFVVSRRTRRWLDRGQTRAAVLALSALSACAVIASQLL